MYLFCKRWIKAAFIFPAFLLFFCYTVYPLIKVFITSFKNETASMDYGFVGLDNWASVLRNEFFIVALKNTFIVVGGELILTLPLGILMGFLLYSKFRGSDIVKVVTFVPYILSGVMCAIIWSFILDPGTGLINSFLKSIGLGALALEWIGGTHLTPYSVAFVDTWKSVGFIGVIFLTGLKMLPKDAFEAALIDGATSFQKTIYITLPLLKETIKLASVMIIIGAFNSFQTVTVLTNGGPNYSSNVLTTYLYQFNFNTYDFGKGSVVAMILFGFIMVFSIAVLVFTRKRVEQ